VKMIRIGLAALAVGAALPALAQQPSFNATQQDEIRKIIRDYLVKNPEVIQEAIQELERRQKDAEREARLKILQDKTGPLFTSKHDGVFGNPNGDVTIVEFFDYNCGYCKRALVDLQKLIAEDKNLKVVTKDFPVLGQSSIDAAVVAVAAKQQLATEKLWAFHQKLLSGRGQVGRQQALDAAKEQGVDMARLQKDMENQQIREAIHQNVQIADALGMTGTPSYVLGDDVVIGAVGVDELRQRVGNVRKCGKAAC
jgi:protein-disulfide isomerase